MADFGAFSDTYDSAVEELISQTKDSIVKFGLEKSPRASFNSDRYGDFSDSGRFSSKQTLELPNEKFRMSSSSFTSIDLASPSSSPDSQEKSSNPKSKSKSKLKSSSSWFNKLAPSRAIGCLWNSPSKPIPSSSSNKTMKSSNGEKDIDFKDVLSELGKLSVEEQSKMLKNAIIESQQMRIKPAKFIKTTK